MSRLEFSRKLSKSALDHLKHILGSTWRHFWPSTNPLFFPTILRFFWPKKIKPIRVIFSPLISPIQVILHLFIIYKLLEHSFYFQIFLKNFLFSNLFIIYKLLEHSLYFQKFFKDFIKILYFQILIKRIQRFLYSLFNFITIV